MTPRPFQEPIIEDQKTGILVLHWSRQIGKTTSLAYWALRRLIARPGRLVTLISNSVDNAAEFILRAAQIAEEEKLFYRVAEDTTESSDAEYLTKEIRVPIDGKTGRIKAKAPNPNTARSLSGDLIWDEVGHTAKSEELWAAIEPILASNADYLARLAGTGNGKNNLFYRLVSERIYPISSVSRSMAYAAGVPIFHPVTREPITPQEARDLAVDKLEYDQNYELGFIGSGQEILSEELIKGCESETLNCFICSQDWTYAALDFLREPLGPLYAGVDIGRSRDLTVITVFEAVENRLILRALLRLSNVPFSQQQRLLSPVLSSPQLQLCLIDMTGIGLGIGEWASENFYGKAKGVHFAQLVDYGDSSRKVRITEAMAMNLLERYGRHTILQPSDPQLRAALMAPERNQSGDKVFTPKTSTGHADDFWSVALACWAHREAGPRFQWSCPPVRPLKRISDNSLIFRQKGKRRIITLI